MQNIRRLPLTLALCAATSGCAGHLAQKDLKPLAEPPELMQASKDGILRNSWSDGGCSFDKSRNTLAYSSYAHEKKGAQIRLDADGGQAYSLLCSDLYSVVFSGPNAIVSLGAEPMLEGREILGGRFSLKNSYYIDISEQKGEGINGAWLSGSKLVIRTGAGSRWSINVTDPQNWKISRPATDTAGKAAPSGVIKYTAK